MLDNFFIFSIMSDDLGARTTVGFSGFETRILGWLSFLLVFGCDIGDVIEVTSFIRFL